MHFVPQNINILEKEVPIKLVINDTFLVASILILSELNMDSQVLIMVKMDHKDIF